MSNAHHLEVHGGVECCGEIDRMETLWKQLLKVRTRSQAFWRHTPKHVAAFLA